MEKSKKNESGKIFKALVIDDMEDNSDVYKNVLKKYFEVDIVNRIFDLYDASFFEQYDLLVMDLYLSGNDMSEENTAFKIIDTFQLTLPILLVTAQLMGESNNINTHFLRASKYKNILDVVSLQDMSNAYVKFQEKIYSDFCLFKGYYAANKKGKITILQISDLQFGSSKSVFVDGIDRQVSEFLTEKEIHPDILVVAGDIAENGDWQQYKDAAAWLRKFSVKLWGGTNRSDYSNRIIIVPGNHDYDLNISASDYYQVNFKSNIQNSYEENKVSTSFKRQKLGFVNFCRFMADFYHDDKWFRYMDKPVHVDDRFRGMGIRFITFNSAYSINASNYKNLTPRYTTLDDVNENDLDLGVKSNKKLCNILVIHNPVDDYNGTDSLNASTRGRFNTFIHNNKLHVCLCGHTHSVQGTTKPRFSSQYAKNLICISSGSLILSQDKLEEGSTRGFSIIELNKGVRSEDSNMENIIVSVKPRYFKFNASSIIECTQEIEPDEKSNPDDVYMIYNR